MSMSSHMMFSSSHQRNGIRMGAVRQMSEMAWIKAGSI